MMNLKNAVKVFLPDRDLLNGHTMLSGCEKQFQSEQNDQQA